MNFREEELILKEHLGIYESLVI